jgi:putative ATPase
LSRCQVYELHGLAESQLHNLLERVESYHEAGLPIDSDARKTLVQLAQGDGRYLLGLCEQLICISPEEVLNSKQLSEMLLQRSALYDKNRDYHYHFISALHKSLRGSDVDAALYWFTRMLEGGEDPLYIARRLVRFASEDIGLADPQALSQAVLAKQAYEQLGSPEGDLSLAQAVIYLAMAPKSNAMYMAFKAARSEAKQTGDLLPPKHILNAPTQMMKKLGYHEGYQYDHDSEDGFSGQNYFPDDMARSSYYQPVERGFEREMCKRLAYWNKLREARQT